MTDDQETVFKKDLMEHLDIGSFSSNHRVRRS
jgi:hypothetical protein